MDLLFGEKTKWSDEKVKLSSTNWCGDCADIQNENDGQQQQKKSGVFRSKNNRQSTVNTNSPVTFGVLLCVRSVFVCLFIGVIVRNEQFSFGCNRWYEMKWIAIPCPQHSSAAVILLVIWHYQLEMHTFYGAAQSYYFTKYTKRYIHIHICISKCWAPCSA